MSPDSTDEGSVTPEALRSRIDELQVPQDQTSLQSLFGTLGTKTLKDLRKSNKWARIEGFQVTTVNDFVRKRLASKAANDEDRAEVLVLHWLFDHQQLVQKLEQVVSSSSIRKDVLEVLEQGFDPVEIAWALRFDKREEIRTTLEEELWDELHDEGSPLLSQHTVRRLEKKNEQLQAKLNEKEDESERLEDEVSRLNTKVQDVEQDLEEEQEYVSSLEEQIAEIDSEKEKIAEKRDELSEQVNELEEKLENRGDSLEEARKARKQLKKQVEKVLGSIASTLDISPLPDDISTASDEIERGIEELLSRIDSLKEQIETLERERDTLAPALDHIKVAWENELEQLADEVESELSIQTTDHPEQEPSKDWKEWLEEERELVFDLLNHLDDPGDQHLSTIGQVQSLLRLRWYLMEWVRYGLLRHLQSASAVADHISDSN